MGIIAAVRQTLIPVLGAVVGMIAGRMVMNFGQSYVGKESEKLQRRLESYCDRCLALLDRAYQEIAYQIIVQYERLSDLTNAAFDPARNTALRLSASVELAQAYGVEKTKIIRTLDELDTFMLS